MSNDLIVRLYDLDYIPEYRIAEAERQNNEAERIENENKRVAFYEEIKEKADIGGTDDYNELQNKPKINDVELLGDRTLENLGIQPSGDYALKSELPTKTSELTNDSDYTTKAYVDEQIGDVNTILESILGV